MYTIENSKHFTKLIDESGVVYYVLSTHIAPIQKLFYFTNPCMDDSERYFWFTCVFPPATYVTFAVIDFETDIIHHFPEASPSGFANPIVDKDTGDIYYSDNTALYRRSPNPEIPLEKICDLPKVFFENHARCFRAATHLTFSPDKKKMLLDAYTENGVIIGALTLENGEFEEYCRPEFFKNHAQFNPVYPDIGLMAEDFNKGFIIRTDENGVFKRLWTVNSKGEQKVWAPLNKERATHEWWSPDGNKIYYCKYSTGLENNGVCSINIFTGEHKVVAPVHAWHAFTSLDEKLVCFDENNGFYRGCPSKVGLYNTETGKKVYINTQNPAIDEKYIPSQYHLDPHPRFNANDKYIAFVTATFGRPDVAIAKTEDVLPFTE